MSIKFYKLTISYITYFILILKIENNTARVKKTENFCSEGHCVSCIKLIFNFVLNFIC